MKRFGYIVSALVLLLSVLPIRAADNVVMVELFTSQGCSSCPPADRTLADLTKRSDVLALSLHVDYWDYLGWRDTFARPEHTRRQIRYRDAMGARVIYTPQMIVNGRQDVPGYREDLIAEAITEAQSVPRVASIVIAKSDGMLVAHVDAGGLSTKCTIWAAAYDQSATVDIARGENAGRQITYHNIVEKLMKVGPWSDAGPNKIALPQPEAGKGIAVWLQNDQTGEVIAASFVNR